MKWIRRYNAWIIPIREERDGDRKLNVELIIWGITIFSMWLWVYPDGGLAGVMAFNFGLEWRW